jgi:2'-hydroxyisoflavone reductase
MKILILGGTQFVGRHLVEAALASGHDVTLFNRGQRNVDLFPNLAKLRGDRNGDMSALRDHTFDSVIDCCGYKPEQMKRTAEALGERLPHYVFISSISAYVQRPPNARYDETAPLAEGDTGYGEEKARSEEAIEAAYPNRVAIVRPGLIVGPYDHTGRFAYWPQRFALGGHVLAPGRPERAIQWIDARDLAEWIVRLCESRTVGAYNAVTPCDANSMKALTDACARASDVASQTHWISDDTLLGENVSPWTELPLWIPEADADAGGLMLASSERAVAAGLTFRSANTTVRETLRWIQTLAEDDAARGIGKTLTAERERELLAKFSSTP